MSGTVLQMKKWTLTQAALDRFLACLDPDRESAGRKYESLRAKLISFFEWRDCRFPEDHADETINRVVRKIGEGEAIRDPSTYVFGVARMLLLEIAKAQRKESAAFEQMPRQQAIEDETGSSEQKVECLKRCLEELPPESRELITQYYQGERRTKIDNRKELSERLGLPLNALRIRAFRLREKLGHCLDTCLERHQEL